MKRRLVLDEPEAKRPEPDDRESPRRQPSHRRLSVQDGFQRYFMHNPPQSRQEKERRRDIRMNYNYKKHSELARDVEDRLRRKDRKKSFLSSVRRSTADQYGRVTTDERTVANLGSPRPHTKMATDLPFSSGPVMGPPRSLGSACHTSNKHIKELGPTAAYERSVTNLRGSPRPSTQMAIDPFYSSLVMGPPRSQEVCHSVNKIIKEEFTNFQEGVKSPRSSNPPWGGGSRSFVQLGPAAAYVRSVTNRKGSPRPPTQMATDTFPSGLVTGPPRSQGSTCHSANKFTREEFTNFQEGVRSTQSSKHPSGSSRIFFQLGRAASDERTVANLQGSQRPATQMPNDHPYSSGPVMGPGGVFKWPPRN